MSQALAGVNQHEWGVDWSRGLFLTTTGQHSNPDIYKDAGIGLYITWDKSPLTHCSDVLNRKL